MTRKDGGGIETGHVERGIASGYEDDQTRQADQREDRRSVLEVVDPEVFGEQAVESGKQQMG